MGMGGVRAAQPRTVDAAAGGLGRRRPARNGRGARAARLGWWGGGGEGGGWGDEPRWALTRSAVAPGDPSQPWLAGPPTPTTSGPSCRVVWRCGWGRGGPGSASVRIRGQDASRQGDGWRGGEGSWNSSIRDSPPFSPVRPAQGVLVVSDGHTTAMSRQSNMNRGCWRARDLPPRGWHTAVGLRPTEPLSDTAPDTPLSRKQNLERDVSNQKQYPAAYRPKRDNDWSGEIRELDRANGKRATRFRVPFSILALKDRRLVPSSLQREKDGTFEARGPQLPASRSQLPPPTLCDGRPRQPRV